MSSITSVPAASSSSSALIYPKAFGDKKYKTLRVAADYTYNRTIALFYRIISTCASLCCFSGTANKYWSLGHYHDALGKTHWIDYRDFKNRIVNFSCNGPKQPAERLPEGVSELDALRKRFGEKKISKWLKIGSSLLPLRKEHLRRNDIMDGCCLGMSLEFDKKYLKGVKRGLTPTEAVKYASYRYEKGATDKAELIQIFGNALTIWKNEEPHVIQNKENERTRILASQIGLQPKETLVYPFCSEGKDKNQLEQFIQTMIERLPNAVYKVTVAPIRDSAHGVSLIKNRDVYAFFEPNRAALTFNSRLIALLLRHIAVKELKADKFNLDFTPLSLNSK